MVGDDEDELAASFTISSAASAAWNPSTTTASRSAFNESAIRNTFGLRGPASAKSATSDGTISIRFTDCWNIATKLSGPLPLVV